MYRPTPLGLYDVVPPPDGTAAYAGCRIPVPLGIVSDRVGDRTAVDHPAIARKAALDGFLSLPFAVGADLSRSRCRGQRGHLAVLRSWFFACLARIRLRRAALFSFEQGGNELGHRFAQFADGQPLVGPVLSGFNDPFRELQLFEIRGRFGKFRHG